MASDNRSQYPYLSEKDWSKNKHDQVQLEKVNEVRKYDLEEKWANFNLSENNWNVESLPQSNARNELRLVIIGKTGQGKSATANTILGKDVFKADYTASSVTSESRRVTELVDERTISVMDTPGLQDTHQSNKNILKELARITTLYPDGVHAFIYVMNMADPRFTAEDKNVLDLIEKTFGGHFNKYCMLLFSHGDSELKDKDLDTYKKKQMEIGQATSGHATPQTKRKEQKKQAQKKQTQNQKNLSKLLEELSWKMLAVDNTTSVPIEKSHYRKQIVAMVDRMRTFNTPEIYTNDMFLKAQEEREAMRLKGLRKGWHPSVMSIVEELLATNPSISQEQIQVEVRQYVQQGNVKKSMELKRKQEEFEKERIAEEKRLQEQKRIDEEKREAEEKERKKKQEEEDKEREETIQKEERERKELRERDDREWQLKQEQMETERQNRFKDEEIERQRSELAKQAKQEEDFEKRRKHQQEMLEDQLREDKQRRQEQEDEHLKRREEEESRRKMQLEQEGLERREQFRFEETKLEKRRSEIKKEELERQQAEQERLKRQEEEKTKIELFFKEQREERLQEMEELERKRKAELDKQDLERQMKREQDDMERQREWEEEQEKIEQAQREKRQRAVEELNRIEQDIKKTERLQNETLLKEQVKEIQEEHNNIFVKSVNGMVNYASQFKEWVAGFFD